MSRKRRKGCLNCSIEKFLDNNKQSRVGRIACSFCDHYIMGNPIYVIMLGLIGTVITAYDVIRVMNYSFPHRRSSRNHEEKKNVAVNIEKDMKLMICALAIEHYTFIMLGAITEYPMLHIPWLLMQLCIMILEVIIFFIRLFLDGLHLKRDEIFLAIWSIHNWLQVFCLFHRQARHPIT